MFDITKCFVYELLDTGAFLREITAEIAIESDVGMIYTEGPLKFTVNDKGDILCEGPDFTESIVERECPLYLAEGKFREYFDKAVNMDLTDYDNHIVDKISYKDFNYYNALFNYVWAYLKCRITI